MNDYAEQDAQLLDENAAQQAEWDALPLMTLTIETSAGGYDCIENKYINAIARALLDRVAKGWRKGTQPKWDMDELDVKFTIEGVDNDAAWEQLVSTAMELEREAVRSKLFWEADAIEQATPCPKHISFTTRPAYRNADGFDVDESDPLDMVRDALRETRCSHLLRELEAGEYELVCTSASEDGVCTWVWTPKSTLDKEAAAQAN